MQTWLDMQMKNIYIYQDTTVFSSRCLVRWLQLNSEDGFQKKGKFSILSFNLEFSLVF